MKRSTSPDLDVARVESLIDARLRGDAQAAARFVDAFCAFALPTLERMRLLARADEDAPREVMTRVLDRLARDEGRALAGFQDWRARNPHRTIRDWLLIVLTNGAREHVRAERARRAVGPPSRTRVINELVELTEANEPGERAPMTPLQTARAIIEYARSHLPVIQLQCLDRWLVGGEFEEISVEFGLAGPEDAQRQVRAALASLRRHYAPPRPPVVTEKASR